MHTRDCYIFRARAHTYSLAEEETNAGNSQVFRANVEEEWQSLMPYHARNKKLIPRVYEMFGNIWDSKFWFCIKHADSIELKRIRGKSRDTTRTIVLWCGKLLLPYPLGLNRKIIDP